MIPLEIYSYWVALGAVFLQCVIVYLFFEYLFLREKYLSPYIGRFALWIVCAVGIISAALSLIYSEVYRFIPCGLCWLERGLLYSLIILTAVALWKNYRDIRRTVVAEYGIVVSALGASISFYHHYIQMGGSEFIVCPTSGGDCARRLVFEFGYITFPLMACTMFIFFIACFLIYRETHA